MAGRQPPGGRGVRGEGVALEARRTPAGIVRREIIETAQTAGEDCPAERGERDETDAGLALALPQRLDADIDHLLGLADREPFWRLVHLALGRLARDFIG